MHHEEPTHGILYNKRNILRVYFITRKIYSEYTIQHGEPTQGILYNMENLLTGYFTTRRTFSG